MTDEKMTNDKMTNDERGMEYLGVFCVW